MEYIYQNKKVYYEVKGSGKPIIMLHGWGQSIDTFSYITNSIIKKCKVYLIDLPGFGKSEEPIVYYDLDHYVDLINRFIKDLNIVKPIVLGHSFGGRIALRYASHNKNINKLILISSAGIKPHDVLKSKLKILIYKMKKFYYKLTKNIIKYNVLIENSGSVDYKNASPVMKKTLSSVVNTYLDKEIKKIECKTLLLWGKNDKITPLKDAYKMKRKIKNSNLIVIEGAGHFSYLDSKRYVTKIINDYIGE